MSFSFNTSLSGLTANANALSVVGNNIANANTIGFRSSAVTFADVFAGSSGARLNGAGQSMGIGTGVRTGAVHTNFSQGGLNESGSSLHAAIQGNGFFVVKDKSDSVSYTRAGDFTLSKDGFIQATNGSKVQGFSSDANGTIPPGAALGALRLPLGQSLPPALTSEAAFRMNLDAGAPTGSELHATMKVYDSKGTEHTLDLEYVKQANGTFQMTATLDGNAARTSVNGGAAALTPVVFAFDSNGNPTSPTTLSIIPDQTQLDGATLPTIAVAIRETNPDGTPGATNITNFARPSAVSSTRQNGFPAGELEGSTITPDGVIYGVYTNGQTRVMGQIALATFTAADGLIRTGGNMFVETLTSGQATIGAPNMGGRGSLVGGMLEQSNVNITNEFIDLIEAQRGFQSNSRVITTLNQTFQDLLQIV